MAGAAKPSHDDDVRNGDRPFHIIGEDLVEWLRTACPSSHPRLTSFPTGAFMVDLDAGSESYVIEHYPALGTGLSRLDSATFGWEGVEVSFDSRAALEDHCRRLFQNGADGTRNTDHR